MLSKSTPPDISNRCACVVDRDAVCLTAVISSYLFTLESYVPVFLFPKVDVPRVDDPAFLSADYVATLMADQASVLIGNALARLAPAYVIVAGLSEAQKSFLTIPKQATVIDISSVSEIAMKLSSLLPRANGEVRCRSSDVLDGLNVAQQQQKRLTLDENADVIPQPRGFRRGVVVVERVADVSPIIAINYANSVGASVLLVDALSPNEGRDVQRWIEEWKENSDNQQLERITNAIRRRIGNTDFAGFEYATFFTEGLPYSFALENVIPCSHVLLSVRPDLFILNNIMFPEGEPFHAAVVMSPVYFADEETNWLCNFLVTNNCYLRALIGAKATLAEFDFHAQHFPYDVLHICSHGGEVDGYEMSNQFIDQSGVIHRVEFDEVIGVTPVPDEAGMVAVHRKMFPRRLDGFRWMSAELKQQNLPKHVILGMWKCMTESRGRRKQKGRIAMSCAIACVDSIHQGEFSTVASHSSPIVFNNSCWSWHEVALFFLSCGARAYIGTLWAIDNDAAVFAAQTFYQYAFSESILMAYHKAINVIAKTPSKGIYVYWGLHFTRLSAGRSVQEAKGRVYRELVESASRWNRKIETTKSAEVKKNSIKVLRSILNDLRTNFPSERWKTVERQMRSAIPRSANEVESVDRQASVDCDIEYKHRLEPDRSS